MVSSTPKPQPTISEIYAAFDAESHQIFRTAMSLSRGGVVRVDDLLAAICCSGIFAQDLFPETWVRRSQQRSQQPWMTPMSNEPLLLRYLTDAFHLATNVDNQSATITPRILFAVGFLSCAGLNLSGYNLTSALLDSPESVAREVERTLANRRRAAPVEKSTCVEQSDEEAIDDYFTRWIALNRL
ncbi:MAG: hypothetical protein R3C11_01375 [Planctomycetaceae bacterium]